MATDQLTPKAFELGVDDVAIVMTLKEDGVQAKIIENLSTDEGNVLVPIALGIIGTMTSNLDGLIQAGIDAVKPVDKVN